MDTLKKAGAMLVHLELFHSMQDLRRLLQLAAHMKERGDRAMLISAEEISLIGAEPVSAAEIVTSRGETIDAATAYRVLGKLEGYEAPEYVVNREALAALNARAVAELERSDALAAFEATLARIGAPDPDLRNTDSRGTDPRREGRSAENRPTETSPEATPERERPGERGERPPRQRRQTEADQTPDAPATEANATA